MEIKEIYDLYRDYLDKEIVVKGWIRKHRKQKEIGFIDISDGTCFKKLQIVYDKDLSDFDKFTKIHFGSAIEVKGILQTKEDAIELKATEVKVIGDCAEDYPIQAKKHTKEFLREQAYLRPRTTLFQAVFRVRNAVSMAIHEYFQSHGYIYLHAPIFTASDCEGAGEMFQVTTQELYKISKDGKLDYSDDFFKKKVGLSVSTQFEAETFAQSFSKVYTFGPTFRADHSNTPYHAAEFWQIEPEVAFCDLDRIIDIAEDVLKFVIKYALEHAKEELEYLDEYEEKGLIEKLEKTIKQEFKRVTYKECIEILQKAEREWEFKPEYGADIAKEHEKYLTEYFKCPIFITMWKKELKSFYMKQLDDGTVASADLELPGIGETFGMSQREDDYEKLLERMKELDMKIEDYEWYLKLRKYGTCERSGFGIGFERLLMYITGIKNIRDVIPYPRTYGSCKY
ncbi:MAG: asparagine--tRNA ligase [Clostridia bacterium]|nr:asparagine--tRNA ligase [Clostridia bacterium]